MASDLAPESQFLRWFENFDLLLKLETLKFTNWDSKLVAKVSSSRSGSVTKTRATTLLMSPNP